MGAKLSTASIISIVSTQVAPRLHQTQTREGQLDTLLRGNLLVFYREIEGYDDIVISYQLQLLSGFDYLKMYRLIISASAISATEKVIYATIYHPDT